MSHLKTEPSMRRFSAAPPFGDVGVVLAQGLIFQDFQLRVEPLQLGPDVLWVHVFQRHFGDVSGIAVAG